MEIYLKKLEEVKIQVKYHHHQLLIVINLYFNS